jgi:uncharacterized protein YcbK (DUF882 family)
MAFSKHAAAIAAITVLSASLTTSSKAANVDAPSLDASVLASSQQQYHLRMHHLHTGEDIDVVYRIGNTYIPAALDELNHFLRDHRTQDASSYDPKEFDETGVAEHSQHMLAKAIDIRVPGISTVELRNAALALHAGGVGFYPVSQFVHVDVGPVRTWSFR